MAQPIDIHTKVGELHKVLGAYRQLFHLEDFRNFKHILQRCNDRTRVRIKESHRATKKKWLNAFGEEVQLEADADQDSSKHLELSHYVLDYIFRGYPELALFQRGGPNKPLPVAADMKYFLRRERILSREAETDYNAGVEEAIEEWRAQEEWRPILGFYTNVNVRRVVSKVHAFGLEDFEDLTMDDFVPTLNREELKHKVKTITTRFLRVFQLASVLGNVEVMVHQQTHRIARVKEDSAKFFQTIYNKLREHEELGHVYVAPKSMYEPTFKCISEIDATTVVVSLNPDMPLRQILADLIRQPGTDFEPPAAILCKHVVETLSDPDLSNLPAAMYEGNDPYSLNVTSGFLKYLGYHIGQLESSSYSLYIPEG
ncbi:hypothetical protein BDV95DRAFT_592083 [Massariosphaeria phaeospora]|uniref:Uncharacterized protein n=1 Tax=Massariosphaeria phaeospora TaxID=100035 RepID=A0A7C8MH97_9PLEO|nr:hypothetical protein BDV95DRAFT_592083 [Massariosphaeria phaeospora]